ncbi:MAG: YybH family protein [Gaiellales bacterium]
MIDAHDELYRSLNAMLGGDPSPVLAVWSDADDVTYAGPFGGVTTGRAAVADAFTAQAAMHLAGRLEVSDVTLVETDGMGYTFCTEHGIDHVIDGASVNLTHRATNVFRREADGWRLVHHHTDRSSG